MTSHLEFGENFKPLCVGGFSHIQNFSLLLMQGTAISFLTALGLEVAMFPWFCKPAFTFINIKIILLIQSQILFSMSQLTE